MMEKCGAYAGPIARDGKTRRKAHAADIFLTDLAFDVESNADVLDPSY
jgi:hypothetical protein